MDPELARYAADIMSRIPAGQQPEPPPVAPRAGQSHTDWLAQVARIRAQHDELAKILAVHQMPAGPEVASVHDVYVPVVDADIIARVYTPVGQAPFPALVFFHGGAWWLAGGEQGLSMTDDYCRTISAATRSVVINVDYRLAPEQPFPGQLEDAFTAVQWTVDHAAALHIDPSNVSVMGASSGGNLAAAVCLLARERGGPAIRSQILHVPALDLTGGSPSVKKDPAGWEALSRIIELYATHRDRTAPLVSPLLAELHDLPPTLVITGLHDPLRDDGRRYVERLKERGIDALLLEYPMLHNIATPSTTERMFADMAEQIRRLQGETGT
ncbi:alpha/beta hydrolase [Streptomyces sp. NPDC057718]|uniref:alpha/beta hydrolase n=1 Tax=Streptomyces sp. NPDC057718 TaxID=3346225 RepID=UPI00367C5E47